MKVRNFLKNYENFAYQPPRVGLFKTVPFNQIITSLKDFISRTNKFYYDLSEFDDKQIRDILEKVNNEFIKYDFHDSSNHGIVERILKYFDVDTIYAISYDGYIFTIYFDDSLMRSISISSEGGIGEGNDVIIRDYPNSSFFRTAEREMKSLCKDFTYASSEGEKYTIKGTVHGGRYNERGHYGWYDWEEPYEESIFLNFPVKMIYCPKTEESTSRIRCDKLEWTIDDEELDNMIEEEREEIEWNIERDHS